MARRKPINVAPRSDVEQNAAAKQRWYAFDAKLRKAGRRLHIGHADTAKQREVRSLVAQRVDMRAAMFLHVQDARRSRSLAFLLRPVVVGVTPVQAVEVRRLMGRVRRHRGEARLLEVNHPR
jgi:hypothetical protein